MTDNFPPGSVIRTVNIEAGHPLRRRVQRVTSRALRTAGNLAGGPLLLWQATRHMGQFEAKQGERTDTGDRTGGRAVA